MTEYGDRLKAKLEPESVLRTLIRAGCLLSAYELIRAEVVDKVRDFYLTGFNQEGYTYDEIAYQDDVLSKSPKSRYRASCAWLVENRALTLKQIATLEEIYRHRQEIAHELPKLLTHPDFDVRTDLLREAVECLKVLAIFWGSIEVDTDPEFDGMEVDYERIESGSSLLMQYLAGFADLDDGT